MPHAQAKGARLYYEETGKGFPIIFVHEFAADMRSWELQVRYFSRRYRCITYNARGFAPSDVPDDPALYGQAIAADDIAAVLGHLGIAKAHVVGLSMGGFATLHFGFRHPGLARSLVVGGCGYGAPKAERDRFSREAVQIADRFLAEGTESTAASYCYGPTRVQLQNKDPRGFAEFVAQFCEHEPLGRAMTLRKVQGERPSLYDLESEMRALTVPTLLVTGDEDEPCLDANIFMKRTIRSAGLWIAPKTGHAINLEEPAAFNAVLQEFFATVEQDRWDLRDPRSLPKSGSILLPDEDQRGR
jgi:pimeloyl-ACP methyl ester carboxylesterase